MIQQKFYLNQLTSEQFFDEIFTDCSLCKISKAFFRFKIENLVNEVTKLNIDLSNEDIDNLFDLCDLVNLLISLLTILEIRRVHGCK